MKNMKDLANKSVKDLIRTLNEKKEALRNFRFGNAGSKSRNVKEGRTLRKDIARIMTALNRAAKAESAVRKM